MGAWWLSLCEAVALVSPVASSLLCLCCSNWLSMRGTLQEALLQGSAQSYRGALRTTSIIPIREEKLYPYTISHGLESTLSLHL
jgi:hypothetical protein